MHISPLKIVHLPVPGKLQQLIHVQLPGTQRTILHRSENQVTGNDDCPTVLVLAPILKRN
jgi:hypothetical protein